MSKTFNTKALQAAGKPLLLKIFVAVKLKVTQPHRLFVTPWTIQSINFSRPEYGSG